MTTSDDTKGRQLQRVRRPQPLRQQQIPFGDDNKNGNDTNRQQQRQKQRQGFFAALRMTTDLNGRSE
jgi:hypothetical protein